MPTNIQSSTSIGRQGESQITTHLRNVLTRRNGYSVDSVHGNSHQTDIIIRHTTHNNVCIEVKSHKDDVRQKEVDKFILDILGLNVSGVFISLHSGIVNKPRFKIESLTNGKFAIYLSYNNYNVGIIQEMISMIYFLEGTHVLEGNILSSNTIIQIQTKTKAWSHQVGMMTACVKNTLRTLQDFHFDEIITILRDDQIPVGDGHPLVVRTENHSNACSLRDQSILLSSVLETLNGSRNRADVTIINTSKHSVHIVVMNQEGVIEKDEEDAFLSHISAINVSGIFASSSGFVGKSQLEIDPQMNGKFAIYLSHNPTDVDIIQEMIAFIHSMELTVQKNSTHLVGQRAIMEIQNCIKDWNEKVILLKSTLHDGLKIMRQFQFDAIQKILQREYSDDAASPVMAESTLHTDDYASTAMGEPIILTDNPMQRSFKCMYCLKDHESGNRRNIHQSSCESEISSVRKVLEKKYQLTNDVKTYVNASELTKFVSDTNTISSVRFADELKKLGLTRGGSRRSPVWFGISQKH